MANGNNLEGLQRCGAAMDSSQVQDPEETLRAKEREVPTRARVRRAVKPCLTSVGRPSDRNKLGRNDTRYITARGCISRSGVMKRARACTHVGHQSRLLYYYPNICTLLRRDAKTILSEIYDMTIIDYKDVKTSDYT